MDRILQSIFLLWKLVCIQWKIKNLFITFNITIIPKAFNITPIPQVIPQYYTHPPSLSLILERSSKQRRIIIKVLYFIYTKLSNLSQYLNVGSNWYCYQRKILFIAIIGKNLTFHKENHKEKEKWKYREKTDVLHLNLSRKGV